MADCKDCDGKCCNYITIQIDEPEDDIDFEELKWFLCHENILVYIDNDDDWCVEVRTNCKNLDENNACKIYATRPIVCLEHETHECEHNEKYDDYYKRLFKTMEDIEAYKQEYLSKKTESTNES